MAQTKLQRKPVTLCALMVVVVLSGLSTTNVAADERAQAKEHFKVGLSLLKSENYKSAVVEFETSVEMYATKGGLFNLANCYKALYRYDEALSTLNRLKSQFKDKLDSEMLKSVRALEGEIGALVGLLTVEVSEEGATIRVDGRKVGKSPLAKPVLVAPGEHHVEVTLSGFVSESMQIKMVSKQKRTAAFELKSGGGGAVSEDDFDEDDGSGLSLVPFGIMSGVTVGLAVATIIINAKISNDMDEAEKNNDEQLWDDTKGLQTGGRVMFGLTAASLVATGVLFFLTDFKGSETEEDSATIDTFAPVAFEGGGGVAVGGSF